VDIDPQAVEVTKLSLLLKVLEGETQETMGQQLALLAGAGPARPGRNIKCGNSLIGPDYFDGQRWRPAASTPSIGNPPYSAVG
jgi:hypothetical protein